MHSFLSIDGKQREKEAPSRHTQEFTGGGLVPRNPPHSAVLGHCVSTTARRQDDDQLVMKTLCHPRFMSFAISMKLKVFPSIPPFAFCLRLPLVTCQFAQFLLFACPLIFSGGPETPGSVFLSGQARLHNCGMSFYCSSLLGRMSN